jgi:hypothetical protein
VRKQKHVRKQKKCPKTKKNLSENFAAEMELHKNRSQVSMAEEVTGVLAEIIAKFGKVSPDRAAVTLNKMKDEGRYCEDIFGQ